MARPRADRKVLQRRERQKRYLARRRVGQSVIAVSADPTDVVDALHLFGVSVPNAHPTTLGICIETLVELALSGSLRVERRENRMK